MIYWLLYLGYLLLIEIRPRVYIYRLPGDGAGLIGCQEYHQVADLLRLDHAAQGRPRVGAFNYLRVGNTRIFGGYFKYALDAFAFRRSGGDGVYPDAVPAHLAGQALCQGYHGEF